MQLDTGHVLAFVGTPNGVADTLRQLAQRKETNSRMQGFEGVIKMLTEQLHSEAAARAAFA